jgi:uncharacterized protein
MASPERGPLVVPVTELVRHPGSHKHVSITTEAEGLALPESRIADGAPVTVDLEFEALSEGVIVHGTISAPWSGECRRCLGPAVGVAEAAVEEIYQVKPITDEAFAFDGDAVDLGPMVRENLLVELPLAPVCRPDCAGLCPACGADRNTDPCSCDTAPSDPRWAGLDALRAQFDPPGS